MKSKKWGYKIKTPRLLKLFRRKRTLSRDQLLKFYSGGPFRAEIRNLVRAGHDIRRDNGFYTLYAYQGDFFDV